MPLTAEELRAMRLADEEIERNFRLTAEDIARARETDRVALFERKDAAAQRAVAQQKVYRATNREKVAARKRAYYEAHREEEAARRKAYYEAHREEEAARKKVYYATHRGRIAAQQKAYRAANREKIAAQQKAYRERKKKEREGLKDGATDSQRLGAYSVPPGRF